MNATGTKRLALTLMCWAALGARAGTAPILDNTPKVAIYTHCSIMGGAHLQKRLDHYYRAKGVSPCPLTVVGTDGRGTAINTKRGYFQPDTCVNNQKYCWISVLDANLATIRAQFPGRPVVTFVQSGIGDNVVLHDTTNHSLIDRSVAELNYLVDKVLKRPVDDLFLSTVQFNYSHRRFAENDPVAVRAFNRQANRARMVDLVTSSMVTILGITLKQPIPVTIMISDGGSYSKNYTDWTNDEVLCPLDSMVVLYPTPAITSDRVYPNGFAGIMGYSAPTGTGKPVHVEKPRPAGHLSGKVYTLTGQLVDHRQRAAAANSRITGVAMCASPGRLAMSRTVALRRR